MVLCIRITFRNRALGPRVERSESSDANRAKRVERTFDLGQDLGQDLGPNLGQDLGQDLSKDLSPNLGQDLGQDLFQYLGSRS